MHKDICTKKNASKKQSIKDKTNLKNKTQSDLIIQLPVNIKRRTTQLSKRISFLDIQHLQTRLPNTKTVPAINKKIE